MKAVSFRDTSDVPVRVLILEDVASDAELAEAALAHADVRFVTRRVATRTDFLQELTAFQPDIVLADYTLPRFTGMEALRLARSLRPDLPFILVTGSRSEEVAVECMKAGADDYILKASLARLPAATFNALGKRAAERGRQAAEEALRRSEQQYRLIAENTRDLVCRLERGGTFLYASPSFREVVGGRTEDLVGTAFLSLIHPDDRPAARTALWRALSEGVAQTVELRYEGRGQPRPFESVVSPVWRDGPAPESLVVVSRDLTERNRMLEAVRVSEERYALALRGANDGIWDWDILRQRAYFSPRWKAMLGYAEDEIGQRIEEWFTRVEPKHLEALKSDLTGHLAGRTAHFENEHPLRHKDGRYLWMLSRGVAVRDASERPCRMAGSLTDVSPRKEAEEQLTQAAQRDPLTGLANRNLFLAHLRQSVARARQGGHRFAVLFVDLDQFKVVNDSLGHLAGDDLLSAAARRLETCGQPPHTVARMGGDEFTLLLRDVSGEHEAIAVAERVQQALRQSFDVCGHEVFTSASIGIALADESVQAAEHVLREADTALFRAKSLGRGRYQVFDRAMHERALAQLQLDTDLRRGLERGEFVVHYQPIVALASGKLEGFEALARWRHPRRGLLAAYEFIGQAEDNGVLLPMGRAMMSEACRQARDWQRRFPAAPPLSINVNLSGRQFAQADLAEQVEHALHDTGLEAPRLALEITESVVMDDAASTSRLLSELKALSVQLNVDDFGTGYSSLSYLHRFPIDVLKIDASFVRRIGQDQDSAEIVRTIITLAHDLGMRVTAEGVETADQLSELRALGCENAQGFYFAAALPPEQADALMSTQHRW